MSSFKRVNGGGSEECDYLAVPRGFVFLRGSNAFEILRKSVGLLRAIASRAISVCLRASSTFSEQSTAQQKCGCVRGREILRIAPKTLALHPSSRYPICRSKTIRPTRW